MQPPQNAPDYITPADARKGVSFQTSDFSIADAGIAQTNSQCLDKTSDRYLEGASASDIVIVPALDPVHDGKTGIEIIPVVKFDTYSEWSSIQPQQGGFIARHTAKPNDAVAQISQESGGRPKVVLTRSSCGTILRETKELFCLFQGAPLRVRAWSSNITPIRNLMTLAGLHRFPNGEPLPLFSRRYLMRTIPKSSLGNRWFVYRFDDVGFVSKPEYEAARLFYADLVERGMYRLDSPGNDAV
jgi:hypothetical protein